MSAESTHQTVTLVPAPALMTAEETCSYLGIGLGRLAELIAEEGLPCTRLGKGEGKGSRRTFHRALVDQWVLDRIKGPREARMDPQDEEEIARGLSRDGLARARRPRKADSLVSEATEAYRIR